MSDLANHSPVLSLTVPEFLERLAVPVWTVRICPPKFGGCAFCLEWWCPEGPQQLFPFVSRLPSAASPTAAIKRFKKEYTLFFGSRSLGKSVKSKAD